MNGFDKFFVFVGRVSLTAAILYLLYRYAFKPYFAIVDLPLIHQLGV